MLHDAILASDDPAPTPTPTPTPTPESVPGDQRRASRHAVVLLIGQVRQGGSASACLVHDISSRGVSVVLITHRLQDLFEVAHRFVVLYEGVVWREMPPAETDLSELVNAMMGK